MTSFNIGNDIIRCVVLIVFYVTFALLRFALVLIIWVNVRVLVPRHQAMLPVSTSK